MSLQITLFYVSAFIIVFCALRAMTGQYIFRSALYLAVTLATLAVQYMLLRAEFVAIVQILVYVGAVIVLIMFAVMLTAQLGDAHVSQTNRLAVATGAASLTLFYVLQKVLRANDWAAVIPAPADPHVQVETASNIKAVGQALLSGYLLPFELVGLILFIALVGAVLIARKDPVA